MMQLPQRPQLTLVKSIHTLVRIYGWDELSTGYDWAPLGKEIQVAVKSCLLSGYPRQKGRHGHMSCFDQ